MECVSLGQGPVVRTCSFGRWLNNNLRFGHGANKRCLLGIVAYSDEECVKMRGAGGGAWRECRGKYSLDMNLGQVLSAMAILVLQSLSAVRCLKGNPDPSVI